MVRKAAAPAQLGLFEGYGIELEYMLVDADRLDVAPAADDLMAAAAGDLTNEYINGQFAWNNELALHVIEFKTNGPQASLDGVAHGFLDQVDLANRLLGEQGLQLMPTGMHPWMNPTAELKLWPHEDREIYAAFDRIFSCKGHGWANLQSMHLNLPFADDDQFGRLHAAVRFLMPLMPGLAASSPVMDGRVTGQADNRLAVYRTNCARVPSVAGEVIPEPVYTMGQYHDLILGPIYRDLAPHDPVGVLRDEWVNARGAIARFDRMALEIRVLDTQECPAMDLALAAVLIATVRALCEETWCDLAALQAWPTGDLFRAFLGTIAAAETTEVTDSRYLQALGLRQSAAPVHRVWAALAEHAAGRGALDASMEMLVEHYLRYGSLATRIRRAVGIEPAHETLVSTYRRLCDCLGAGEPFSA